MIKTRIIKVKSIENEDIKKWKMAITIIKIITATVIMTIIILVTIIKICNRIKI